MISKKILIPVFIFAAIGTAGIFKVFFIKATTNDTKSGLVQYLSEKLGIDQTKVQTVFDDYRSQEQSTRQKENIETYTSYLNGLVSEGKITEDQKTAILAKHSELQKAHEDTDLSSKSREENKTLMEKEKTDLEIWAKEQGIDVAYLHFNSNDGGRDNKGPNRGNMMQK